MNSDPEYKKERSQIEIVDEEALKRKRQEILNSTYKMIGKGASWHERM